jgi:hypothetical protein
MHHAKNMCIVKETECWTPGHLPGIHVHGIPASNTGAKAALNGPFQQSGDADASALNARLSITSPVKMARCGLIRAIWKHAQVKAGHKLNHTLKLNQSFFTKVSAQLEER